MMDTQPALSLWPPTPETADPAPVRRARCGAASLRGSIHPRNEDRARHGVVEGSTSLIALADGLGAGDRGDVAAEYSLRTLFRALRRYLSRDRGKDVHHRYPKLLRAAAGRANLELWLRRENTQRKLGATLCAALVAPDGRAWVINAGDTRCYHVRGTECRQLTQDHSLVEELVRAGVIAAEDAPTHPWRNRVTRNLGRAAELEYDLFEVTLESGDALVLVSDGVWDPLPTAAFPRALAIHSDPAVAASALVKAARRRDGRDDMTCAILVHD